MRTSTTQRLLFTIVQLVPLFLIYDFGLMIFIGPSTRERVMGWQEILVYPNMLLLAGALPHLWQFLEIAAFALSFWLGVAIVAARSFAPRRAVSTLDLSLLLSLSLLSAVVVTAIRIWLAAVYGGPSSATSSFD